MLKMNIKTPQTFKLKIKTHFSNIILANLQEKEIEPTKEEQIVEADFGYDGLKQVNVKPIPSEYIKPTGTKEIIENGIHNVKEFENVDVNISYTPNYQEKNVTPTKEMQIIIADENYDALEKVNVSSIPDEYIIPSGNLDITENGSYDVKDKESVNVEIASSGGSAEEYFTETITGSNSSSTIGALRTIKKMPPLTNTGTNCGYMFFQCANLEELDLSNFNTENVTNMTYMFSGCAKLTSLDLSNFDTKNVKTMNGMFQTCRELTSLDLSKFNVESVTNMSNMFNTCSKLKTLNLDNFNTINLTNISSMFYYCENLTSLDLSSFNVENVTEASYMFYGCKELANINFSNWNTTKLKSTSGMFYDCVKLTSLDLSNWNTENVTNMSSMFQNCKLLTHLDIRNFDFTNVTNYSLMFGHGGTNGVVDDCLIIVKDETAKTWITEKFTRLTNVKTVAEYEAQ